MHGALARRAVLAVCLAVVSATSPIWAQGSDTREAEYLALRANLFHQTTLRADPDAAHAIATVLARIRRDHPDLSQIRASPPPQTMLLVVLTQPVPACLGSRPQPGQQPPALTEPAELVAATRRLGGMVSCSGAHLMPMVIAAFPELLHVPSLITVLRPLPSVRSVEENVEIGGSSLLQVDQEGQRWRVVMGSGWGDCLSGCINWRLAFFIASPDGTITRVADWRREHGRESGQQPWPVMRW